MSRRETRVMGVDLSLASTGIAVVRHEVGSFPSGTVEKVITKGHRGISLDERYQRQLHIAHHVFDTALLYGPDLVVIEAPSFRSRVGAQHDRSGLWWITVMLLRNEGYAVGQVPPKVRAKYATGSGSADKDAVIAAVRTTYGWAVELPEPRIKSDKVDDMADAIVLAAMGFRKLGLPIEYGLLTESYVAMLDKLIGKSEWPA